MSLTVAHITNNIALTWAQYLHPATTIVRLKAAVTGLNLRSRPSPLSSPSQQPNCCLGVAGRYVEVVRILTSAQQPGQCWRSPGLRTVAVTNHLQHTRLLGSAQLPKIHFKLFII